MTRNQIWALGTMLLALSASCKDDAPRTYGAAGDGGAPPAIVGSGGSSGMAGAGIGGLGGTGGEAAGTGGTSGIGGTSGTGGTGGAAGAGQALEEIPCQPGNTPLSPDCPPPAPAVEASCREHGLLFAPGIQMCVKRGRCVPPFQLQGSLCIGTGISGLSCAPLVKVCWNGTTVCWCQ